MLQASLICSALSGSPGFYGFGGNLEFGVYADIEIRTRVLLTPGFGAGYGGAATAQAGYSTGSLSASGADVRTWASGEVIGGVGLKGRYDFRSQTGSVGGSLGSTGARISSNLDATVTGRIGVSAEVSATGNYRVVLGSWKPGELGDLLFGWLAPGYSNAQYRHLSSGGGGGDGGGSWGGPPGQGK